jgi:hypothetical protein
MTQQNAALVEQSAAAAESLKDQAQRLAEVVGRFELGMSGSGVDAPTERSAELALKPAQAATQALARAAARPPAPRTAKPAAPKRAAAKSVAATTAAATSVPTLTSAVEPAAPAAAVAPRPAAAPGDDDDWTSF